MTASPSLGLAGGLAKKFIRSPLTPLIILASLLVGGVALRQLPREEEPQIHVPMFDIFVPLPGSSPQEVTDRLITVGERKLWEIPGVEYIYSTAEPGLALFILRFKVGTNPDEAMTRVFTKVFSNVDFLPPGSPTPLVKPRSIDDVPILSLTLTGPDNSPQVLRRAAADLREVVSSVPNVSEIELMGGRRRQFRVELDPQKLTDRRLSPLELTGLIAAANRRGPAGSYNTAQGRAQALEVDAFIRSIDDLRRVIVGISGGTPVTLGDVARIVDGPDEVEQEVQTRPGVSFGPSTASPAVTLAVSKRRGANATWVAREVLARVEQYKPRLPPGVEFHVTRNLGETAREKSDELLFHMFLATLSVTLLMAWALGLRESLVVLVAIPVTLALTLLVYHLGGYTLNRITLFALIFSVGILVDDAIVVVENIHRHALLRPQRPLWETAVEAVAEVGNPTLLATWTVIAAVLPMAFVGGLMGPYMRPIPVGASFAMIFSALVAFVVSPWAFVKILGWWPPRAQGHSAESGLDRLYRWGMGLILSHGWARLAFFALVAVLLAGALALLPLRRVTVKMLPFDNKSEFEVVVNGREGTSLEATRSLVSALENPLVKEPEVTRVTSYLGTAAPYTFNGLVRHYFLRQRPHQAEIVVNLKDRHERHRSSHQIAESVRGGLTAIARGQGARIQVVEVPPGPPVLSTLVFEIYGPQAGVRSQLAQALMATLEQHPGIVDVDSYVPGSQPLERLKVNREKATLNGVTPASVVEVAQMALSGSKVDLAHVESEPEPVEVVVRLGEKDRRSRQALLSLTLPSRSGAMVPVRELTQLETVEVEPPLYRKNLRPVTYVIADVATPLDSPVYALLDLRKTLSDLGREINVPVRQKFIEPPSGDETYALKWDGEWQITYEVFRDLGVAFALVLVAIYAIVVAWFRSFTVPLVIMAPIPLTLVGILPGHWALGAFFTATSMIGFIAGAGIVVRNSIILVDFIEMRRREGMPLKEAVIDAGAVRFRPMLLTAAAVVVGAGVILFDPIFQGLAVALMAGEIASTLLSRTAVPVLYFMLKKSQSEENVHV